MAQDINQYIENLPKERRDWLEVFGNQWAPVKQMPGTCEACVWGGERHAKDCVALPKAWDLTVKLQGQLNAYMNGQIEIK
jgi:hypothetical protein